MGYDSLTSDHFQFLYLKADPRFSIDVFMFLSSAYVPLILNHLYMFLLLPR